MNVSSMEEYGIRCALCLARYQKYAPKEIIQVSKVAHDEGLSTDYVAKIMHLFRKKGLIKSTRGQRGGFELRQPADEISLNDIFQALKSEKEKRVQQNFCHSFTGIKKECVHHCDCSLRPVWNHLFNFFESALEQITLADLTSKESKAETLIQKVAKKQAKELVHYYK